MNPKIDLIFDMQYGSTGKGLLVGYLAETLAPDIVVNCNMPNAGHTYIDSKGNKMIFKCLPNGIVSPNLRRVMLGPGSVVNLERLNQEIRTARSMGYMKDVKVLIHPNAAILQDRHTEFERESLNSISSTMQGSMAATVEKMMRNEEEAPLAAGLRIDVGEATGGSARVCTHDDWMICIATANHVLAEGSQGYSLGLNGRFWPYCTSRDCTPQRLAADMALPRIPMTVWGTLRTYPIRVGNTEGGYSGSSYNDQKEIDWSDIGQQPEYTTVTGRQRRIFTFSTAQMEDAMYECRPDKIFLNFCNYLDETPLGRLVENIEKCCNYFGSELSLMGYGPSFDDVKRYEP